MGSEMCIRDRSITEIIALISSLSVVCSAIVSATDTPADDRIWAKIYPYIEMVSLTIGKAKMKPGE